MSRRVLAFLVVGCLAASAQALDTTPPSIIATPPVFPAAGAPLVVECQIVDESGVFEPTVFWRAAGAQTWERAALETAGDGYRVSIATPAGVEAFEVFIEAFDMEGNGPARYGTPTQPLRVAPVSVAVAPKELPADEVRAPLPLDDGFDLPSTPATWRKPTAVGMWVAGAVLAAGGAVALAVHRSEANAFNERFYGEGRFDADDRSSIQTLGALGAGLMATGGVAVVGGTVLWVVEF